ncbi:MAG: MBL fold metallo-hydrolase [Rubrobacteraceae bacterium]
MRIEFLGTGGAITTPQPGCKCRVCVQARREGVPYSRSGPSLFVHGPDVLIDTPEEIKDQLNRSRVTSIAACFYSHWHPDHVMGRRVWEMNRDWRGWPPEDRTTDIYLPEQVGRDFRKMLGTWDHLAYLQHLGLVWITELRDGESVEVGDTRVNTFRVAEDYVYAFVFEGEGKKVLIAPDELKGWIPPDWLRGLDVAVLPMGITEFNPLTGERHIAEEHPIFKLEATYEETMEIANTLDAERVILTHVEEVDGLTHDELQELQRRLQTEGRNIEFAHDTLMVDV